MKSLVAAAAAAYSPVAIAYVLHFIFFSRSLTYSVAPLCFVRVLSHTHIHRLNCKIGI